MSGDIHIGELRTRLMLEAPERAGDDGGGAAVTWTTVCELWARVRAVSGGESFALDRTAGTIGHEIVIRHRAGITPQMRFRSADRVFDIRAAFDPDGQRRWTRCLAEERDP